MPKPRQIGLITAMCLFSAFAAAKGERYGVSVNMLNIESMDYEQGSSGDKNVFRYGLVHTRPIDEDNNRWRWWFGLNYTSDYFDAPANGVYQEMSNLELRAVPQFALGNWSIVTPYIGAGLSVGYSQYSNRWTVDEGGRRRDSLKDFEQFEVGAVASFGTAIKLGSNPDAHLQLVPQVSYILPVYNEGAGGFELSLSLLF